MRKSAIQLYDELCEHFGVCPKLTWVNKVNSAYDEGTHTIEMALTMEQGWKFLMTHEFAHALDAKTQPKRKRHHDKNFYECLLAVIDYAYADRKAYKWDYEYPRIQRWALADGYVRKANRKRKIVRGVN